MEEKQETKKNKKTLKGIVVSDKNDKTIIVRVNRFTKHPKYGKFIRMSKRYKAHDENNQCKVGDEVMIEPCRPISKDKKYKLVSN